MSDFLQYIRSSMIYEEIIFMIFVRNSYCEIFNTYFNEKNAPKKFLPLLFFKVFTDILFSGFSRTQLQVSFDL